MRLRGQDLSDFCADCSLLVKSFASGLRAACSPHAGDRFGSTAALVSPKQQSSPGNSSSAFTGNEVTKYKKILNALGGRQITTKGATDRYSQSCSFPETKKFWRKRKGCVLALFLAIFRNHLQMAATNPAGLMDLWFDFIASWYFYSLKESTAENS